MKFFSRQHDTKLTVDELLARWGAASQEQGWIRESDWFASAARALAATLLLGSDPYPALRSLASRRAVQGVGIAESLIDLHALLRVFPHPQANYLVVAYADAWVEATDLFSHRLTCSDTDSGLSSRQHFERRVHELREDPATHEDPYIIAVFRHGHLDHDEMTAFMMAAEIGQACRETLPESVATYRGNRLALLLRRDPVLLPRLDQLGIEIERILADYEQNPTGPRLDIEPLPVEVDQLPRLLGTLWR